MCFSKQRTHIKRKGHTTENIIQESNKVVIERKRENLGEKIDE